MAKDEMAPANQLEEGSGRERIEQLSRMLDQKVPIIGGWMHRRVASALMDSALTGNWLAAQSLAYVTALHEEPAVRKMSAQTLRKINYVTGIDAVWGVWAETRHPELDSIVLGYNRPATHPASIRLLSLLRLSLVREELVQTITRGSADLVPPLIQAWDDRDPQIAAQARQTLLRLENPASIDIVCSAWLDASRFPFLAQVLDEAGYVAERPAAVRVLSALKVNRLDVVTHSSAEMVAPLIEACQHGGAEIAARARQCLGQLQNQEAVDEFCRLWSKTRDPLLETVLLQASYKARAPLEVRLLVALKTGHLATAEKTAPTGLPVLLKATGDADEAIRAGARKALGKLHDPETRDALCGRVIESNDPLALEIALASGYAPRAPETRALFLFLTGQWAAYDVLDFDQSMMRTIYEASPVELRQRIAARVQTAGRTDYLTILAGVDYRARANLVSPSEAELMIRILEENHEYARLWSLAPELALTFSVRIVKSLARAGWRPESEADWPIYDALVELARQPIHLSRSALLHELPLAIQRATVKIRGRINEVAFSPSQPVLAVATSMRKVALWNFQSAKIERVLGDFLHSVGKVSYTARGQLLCAERTSGQAMCAVAVYGEEEAFHLHAHEGTVTALEPFGDDLLLTAGRDNRAFVWDLTNKKKVAEKQYSFWARSAAVSPDRQHAALLHDRLTLVRLPDLSIVPGYSFQSARAGGLKSGVAQNAAFSPDGKYLLTGQYNGQVGMYFHTSLTQRPRKAVVATHSQSVRGIHFLPGRDIVISAGAEGQVRFISWPEMKLLGSVYAPEGKLTSLRVSQNGAFMATGSSDSSLALWDLRVLAIPELFSQPLATANHDQISTVLALSSYHSLPEPVRNGLRFLRLLLEYRFRYDIQVEEAPVIQFGEFDILLDEA